MNPSRNLFALSLSLVIASSVYSTSALEIRFQPAGADALPLADSAGVASILVETNNDGAMLRATGDLAEDFSRVTAQKPAVLNDFSVAPKNCIIVGTLGQGGIVDQLAAAGKLTTNGVCGQWESYTLQIVENPLPNVSRALVIAGSDRRGTIFGCYELSERIGVSPWYWWADVPVKRQTFISAAGPALLQGPPAVKYRGIFLNDEDFGLRPWASKTFDPAAGNIGPKTYAKVFELLLRLRANCLWPAMHHGSHAFNFYPENKIVADHYGIVMGSSHCEQMLRNNVDEWDAAKFGEYNYVNNRAGVLKYWEQRVRENARYESLYTLGMRGIHDGAMPGGGTEREKAARLHTIIADQREMLARLVNTNLTEVPQIFCPYKEVLSLYQLAPEIPNDITLVWPDDNFGYIREFSDARERQRSGGAGVYYHISYWGAPYNYLWLNSTPPALIAEEMTKAFDYGANRVWILNVGDLKPGEIGMEFFLRLAWNPHQLDDGAAEDTLLQIAARDFGPELAPDIVKIWNEYFRLNLPRKPEHMGFDAKNWLLNQPAFSTVLNGDETEKRLTDWRRLVKRVDVIEPKLSGTSRDAFFELVGYPVRAAAAANVKGLALTRCFATPTNDSAKCSALLEQARQAETEIHRLTDFYNQQLAAGKWNRMMSDHPGDEAVFKIPSTRLANTNAAPPEPLAGADDLTQPVVSADFVETDRRVIMEAEHASEFVPGADAKWKVLRGLGYNGEAVAVTPVTVPVRATPEKILAESPCLQFKTWLRHAGDWRVTLRTLPTFSVETGQPQRYAVAFDDAPPQIVALKTSTNEKDPWWQENVMRNAATTSSRHNITSPGLHTLKVWMVDPGIVIDTIAAENGSEASLGLLWPEETKLAAKN
jgi:hypothetical protein